jgi:hypothetical protein
MSLVFGLSTPKTVFMIISGISLTDVVNHTTPTDLTSGSLSAFTCLGSFCGGGEKQVGETLAGCFTHPIIVR